MNFVVCILRHDFDQSYSVFQTHCSIFEDDVSRFFYRFRTTSGMLSTKIKRSKDQSFRNKALNKTNG